MTFVLIILATLIIGAIMISDGKDYYKQFYNRNSQTDISGISIAFSTQGGIIVGMFFLSIVLAIIFLLMVKKFPKCVIYSLIILFYLVLVALIVLGIVSGIWWMVATFGVILLVITCVLYCFRDRIKTGIILLKVAADFIS